MGGAASAARRQVIPILHSLSLPRCVFCFLRDKSHCCSLCWFADAGVQDWCFWLNTRARTDKDRSLLKNTVFHGNSLTFSTSQVCHQNVLTFQKWPHSARRMRPFWASVVTRTHTHTWGLFTASWTQPISAAMLLQVCHIFNKLSSVT